MKTNTNRAVAAVAAAILTFLLVIIAVEGAEPAGKVEDTIAKPAAAAFYAPVTLAAPGKAGGALAKPLRQEQGKVERGPIGK